MSGHPPPTGRPLLAAPVLGFAAYAIAAALEDAMPARMVSLQRQAEAGKIDPALLRELAGAWAAIRCAGQEWARWRVAADGTAEPVAAEPLARSPEVDTGTAAALLGVTPRRVRQLAQRGDLAARRAGRVWLVQRVDVDLRRATA